MALVSRFVRVRDWLALAGAWALLVPSALPVAHSQEKEATTEQGKAVAGDEVQAELLKKYPPLRDLDSHCPFTPPESLDAWKKRSAEVKQQLMVSLGLLPMPKLEPVKPNIYGRIPLDGYTIEKVTFETLPGFYVTGNLYRPDPMPQGKVPAVLCPHGHWSEARFFDVPEAERNQLLATGAERFESAARNHIQARCVQLARMGCVVFHWDMIGYCDSQQINFDRAHRFAKQPRESEVSEDGWLLFSPLAESHAQSILGLQTLAGIRGVDFLLTLPEVDSARIGITGASGGGTQSFITAAVDPRIAVAFPAVMVSTGMQGGCTCENASGLRTGTGNIEMAAVIAPRPLGMTAADDWTKTMPSDGFPQLQQLYNLFGAKDKVALFPAIHFGHNYNHVARVSMYGWMNKHFQLGFKEPVLERDFEWKGKDDLLVWDDEHPKPEGGEAFERKLMKSFRDNINAQYDEWLKNGQEKKLADTLMQGWQVCLGLTNAPLEKSTVVSGEPKSVEFSSSNDGPWSMRHDAPGKAALSVRVSRTADASGNNAIKETIFTFALLGQSFGADGQIVELKEQPLVGNPRLAAAYTYGYNEPLFTHRARQLGAALRELKEQFPGATLVVEGQGTAAALAAAGAVCAQDEKETAIRLRLAPDGFRFASAESIRDPNFLPASARYLDLPGLVSCFSGQIEITGDDKAEFVKLKAGIK